MRPIAVTMLFILASTFSMAQNNKGTWIKGPRADAFWKSLAESPYAQDGDHGMVLYMLSYSRCGNCITFLRDFWQPHRAEIQLREIFAPVSQPMFLNEAADVALTRDPAIADAYYHQTRVAPPVGSSVDRRAALDRVERFVTATNAMFRELGHVQDGYPTFVFRVKDEAPPFAGQDKLWIVSGWGPELARDLNAQLRSQSGEQSEPGRMK